MLLKPKTDETTRVNERYPIVSLLKIDSLLDSDYVMLKANNFEIKEWAYIKPIEKP